MLEFHVAWEAFILIVDRTGYYAGRQTKIVSARNVRVEISSKKGEICGLGESGLVNERYKALNFNYWRFGFKDNSHEINVVNSLTAIII